MPTEQQIKDKYLVRDAIKAQAGKQVGVNGCVPCPLCDFGSVHYRIGRRYKLDARCTTQGCVDWKEGYYAS